MIDATGHVSNGFKSKAAGWSALEVMLPWTDQVTEAMRLQKFENGAIIAA